MWVVNYIKIQVWTPGDEFLRSSLATRFSVLEILQPDRSTSACRRTRHSHAATHNEALEFPLAPYGRYIDRV